MISVYAKLLELPPKNFSIPGNGVKNLLRPNDVYKFLTLLLKDYYLILGNDAKNLLRLFFIYIKNGFVLSCKMAHLKFMCVVLITASAQVVQVIKVDT